MTPGGLRSRVSCGAPRGVKAFVLAQRLYLFIPPVPVVFS